MNPKDKKELESAYFSLKLQMFVGCNNKCSKCKKTGHHGSIPLYVCESGNEYLICGWCGHIEKKYEVDEE